MLLLFRLAQYIKLTPFGSVLRNFGSEISNFKFRSVGPPVAAGEPGSLQPAGAACSMQFDRGYLQLYNLIYSSRMHIVLKKGPCTHTTLYPRFEL